MDKAWSTKRFKKQICEQNPGNGVPEKQAYQNLHVPLVREA